MIYRIKLIIYYLLIIRLPHSRILKKLGDLRVWYVCNILKIMKPHPSNYFENGVYIGTGNTVSIGEYCHINENVFIQGCTIGNHVMIAPNVAILSVSHNYERSDIPMIQQGETAANPPIIEDNVWIGRSAIILPGVIIRSGSVVAAGSIVTKNVEINSVVGGVPAKLLKNRLS